jgi:hypothetical protein
VPHSGSAWNPGPQQMAHQARRPTYTTVSFLQKKYEQCRVLWDFLLKEASSPGTFKLQVRDMLELAHILEENIHTTLILGILTPSLTPLPTELDQIQQFYHLPEIPNKQIKFSNQSVSHQLHNWSAREPSQSNITIRFFFSLLFFNTSDSSEIMQGTQPAQPTNIPVDKASAQPKQTCWVNDTSVATLSSIIREQLEKDQTNGSGSKLAYVPTPEDSTQDIHGELCQNFQFNIIRHRGSIGSSTTLSLFKSFTSALRSSDSSILILPYSANKQHFSPLSTIKQINSLEDNQMLQYYKPFYHRQLYSLSGYFHISSQLSFNDIMSQHRVQEWLDSNQYFIKLCPSQEEEMIPLGALCYSHILMSRDDLKDAIYKHPLWKSHFPSISPIFDIYLEYFLASNKKEKMLFVSGEKSKAGILSEFFKILYNGNSKKYSNASMMLFIPFNEGTHLSTHYREKILFNHLKFNGTSAVTAVGGLNDLNTELKLKTGQSITLRELLKSIPASPGMSCSLLFHHFESNSAKTVHMAIYHKEDIEHFRE